MTEQKVLRIGLSRKKHLPVFWLLEKNTYGLWEFMKVRRIASKLPRVYKVVNDNLIEIDGLLLRSDYASMLCSEYECWEECYLPPFSLLSKTVLDVGAGCGETAKFFLDHGAERVICVERDPGCIEVLQANAKKLDLDVVPETFNIKHLLLRHDFMKMDVDGYEVGLLSTDYSKPAVVEVHGFVLVERFRKRGYSVQRWWDKKQGVAIMNNFARVLENSAR